MAVEYKVCKQDGNPTSWDFFGLAVGLVNSLGYDCGVRSGQYIDLAEPMKPEHEAFLRSKIRPLVLEKKI